MVLSGCIKNSLTLDDEFPVHPVTANWRRQNLDNDNASRERAVSSGDTDALNAVTGHLMGICSSLAISALALKVVEVLKVKEAPSAGSLCALVRCPPVAEPPRPCQGLLPLGVASKPCGVYNVVRCSVSAAEEREHRTKTHFAEVPRHCRKLSSHA
jgi:hypothetical protein